MLLPFYFMLGPLRSSQRNDCTYNLFSPRRKTRNDFGTGIALSKSVCLILAALLRRAWISIPR
jgi:hypothetical protein